MTKTRRIPSAVALVMAFMLAFATGASAASPAPVDPEPVEPGCDTIAVASGDEADAMTDAFAAALQRGEVTVRAPERALDVSESVVYTIESEEGTFTSVTVPIGDAYSMTSNVTVLFDETGSIVQSIETLVGENDVGNFEITSYIDGDLISSQDTGLSYLTDAELQQEIATAPHDLSQGLNAETQSTNTGACLAAVLGVSGVFGAIIAKACAGACAAAAVGVGVPVCVACVAGFATIGGASITAVASCF